MIKEEPMDVDLPGESPNIQPEGAAAVNIPPVKIKTEPGIEKPEPPKIKVEPPKIKKEKIKKEVKEEKDIKLEDSVLKNFPAAPRRPSQNARIDMMPDKILNATHISGQMVYQISCKNSDRQCYVTAESARKCYPQLVIDFFEERIEWDD